MARQGIRAPWASIPADVRRGIDEVAGSAVVDAVNLAGGFSPGPAARCQLADGRVVFVKAAGDELNPDSPHMHRREAAVLAVLPESCPAPNLIGFVDEQGWVALVVEWAAGRMPTAPLSRADVARLLRLVDRLAAAGAGVRPTGVRDVAETHATIAGHWQRLLDEPLAGLDAWSVRYLDRLAALEADYADATVGDHLVHSDFRSDNVLFSDDGDHADIVVDWPSASIGAPWIDLVGLLPAMHLDGGPAPQDVFATHPLGQVADPASVDVYLAAITGFFTRSALLPPPPGLPTLRPFQSAQGEIARRWLAHRRQWLP